MFFFIKNLLIYREKRLNFIRAKYVEKRFARRTCQTDEEKLYELEEAVNNGDLDTLLQAFAENVDLSAPLLNSVVFLYRMYNKWYILFVL